MQSNESVKNRLGILAIMPAFLLLVGFAAQQAAPGRSPDQAVTLTYQFPEGKTLAYRQSGTETQNLDIMGSTMTTESQSTLEFSLKPKGAKDNNFNLGVTIDVFKANIQGPQGNMSPDASSVLGKSFDMVLSRLGKEIDTAGASTIQYDLPTSGRRDMSGTFQAFFPDLPDRAVKVGDSWPSEDVITEKTESGSIRIELKSVNTLDGFETLDGIECARIKSVVKGAMTGALEQGGIGLNMDCTVNGNETWYFAVKEGFYLKAEQKLGFGGIIKAGEPVNADIPITGTSRADTQLLPKK